MSSEISLENEKSDRNTVQKSFFSWDNLRERHLSPRNGFETKISRTFLDFLHLGHEFFVISGLGT